MPAVQWFSVVHGVETCHLVTETAKFISQVNDLILEVISRHFGLQWRNLSYLKVHHICRKKVEYFY